MLRGVLLVCACAFLLIGLFALTQGPEAWPMLVMAAILLAGTLFERFNYRGSEALDGNWQPTEERFLDEESGRPVTVWFNPATGERRYVTTGEATPPDPARAR